MEVMNDIEKSVCDSAVKTWSTINKVYALNIKHTYNVLLI